MLQKLSQLDVHKLQNLTYQLQKCFSFWGGSAPRLLPGALPLDPTAGLLSPAP